MTSYRVWSWGSDVNPAVHSFQALKLPFQTIAPGYYTIIFPLPLNQMVQSSSAFHDKGYDFAFPHSLSRAFKPVRWVPLSFSSCNYWDYITKHSHTGGSFCSYFYQSSCQCPLWLNGSNFCSNWGLFSDWALAWSEEAIFFFFKFLNENEILKKLSLDSSGNLKLKPWCGELLVPGVEIVFGS